MVSTASEGKDELIFSLAPRDMVRNHIANNTGKILKEVLTLFFKNVYSNLLIIIKLNNKDPTLVYLFLYPFSITSVSCKKGLKGK